LGRQLKELLFRQQINAKDSKYVFPSPLNKNKKISDVTPNIAHKRLGFPDHNAHGLRSSFSTICYEHQREHSFSAEVIETQLAHKMGSKITRAYLRSDFLEERRELMEWWELLLEETSSAQK
jgi:integrase